MFFSVIRYALKITRKEYLIPYLEGLLNLGRPATVFFPSELIEQGLGLLLSGLNNTLAIQSNLDWVWPLWLERQQDPDAREFIPTGVNVVTSNLSMRTWTSIGIPGSPREGMIDPVGMLTLQPFGWSVMPYVRIGEQSWFPPRMGQSVRQYLEEGDLPCVITEYPVIPGLDWQSRALVVRESGEELICFNHHLKNCGSGLLELTFGLSIRPYNPLTVGHINKLVFKNLLWRANGKPGLLLMEAPDMIRISDRHCGDPILMSPERTTDSRGVSKSGILAGTSEYKLTLEPGESRHINSYGTLAKISRRPNLKFRNLTQARLDTARKRTLEHWRTNRYRGLTVTLPDPRLETAFYSVKNHLHVFDDQQHFSPGTFFYHNHWIRDSCFIALAFGNIGFTEEVAHKVPGYMATQTGDGFFRSQNGEWDSTGQVLVVVIDHVRRTGDKKLLEETFPALFKGARWIESMRSRDKNLSAPHAGLMPAGISAEHFGPNDHYYWDNFWSLAGLERLLWAAEILGKDKEHRILTQYHDGLRHDLVSSMDQAMERAGDHRLPCSPYRNMDSAAIGNLVAISPLDLFDPDSAWVKPTLDFLMENNLKNGLFFQRIIHTGLNAYLTVQMARLLLATHDARFSVVLKGLLDNATSTWTWPEAIHPRTQGGCMGDGDHGWAAGEFVSLVRQMLVREQGSHLYLACGILPEWFEPGMTVELDHAPTLYGLLGFRLEYREKLTFKWSLERNALQKKTTMRLVLPKHIAPINATAIGSEKAYIDIPEAGGELEWTPGRRINSENRSPHAAVKQS